MMMVVTLLFTPHYTQNIQGGNEEALVSLKVHCGDGMVNQRNPPCSNLTADLIPRFEISVTQHNNQKSDPYLLAANPLVFNLAAANLSCFNTFTNAGCDGHAGPNCTCYSKISGLPKYSQLKVTVATIFDSLSATSTPDVSSNLFALTDVATAAFLSDLYSIPSGISVKHGSNQSVAEFYGQFYSNSDLASFLDLSGLPRASIPESNVFGTLPNNSTNPGGEVRFHRLYMPHS
jgi:hypothetical protein